ncbi:MAG: preprotein translocase subunit SecE [Patescibacteria group bacterium]
MSLITYLKDTRTELKHVSWSTRSQAINYTALVISFSLLVALILAALDFLFVALLKLVI